MAICMSAPKEADAFDEQFLNAIAKAEERLGLSRQPRMIVVHEKDDHIDAHAHANWSRMGALEMKAILMRYNKICMRDINRELFVEHGHCITEGLINRAERPPLIYTFEQYQHVKQLGKEARVIKRDTLDAWNLSDNAVAFNAALTERGLKLARGDRRGLVVADIEGEAYSLPKWLGIKSKAVRERLGEERDLSKRESYEG